MRRRTLLTGLGLAGLGLGGGAVLAGCTGDAAPAPTTDSGTPEPSDNDAEVVATAAAEESALIRLYDQALASNLAGSPAVAALLSELASQHRLHLQAITTNDAAVPDDQQSGTAPTTLTLADLVAAERLAADQRTASCEQVQANELARTLALISASEAAHAQAITAVMPA